MNAAHLLNKRIAKLFCLRPLTDVLTRKSNAPPGGPHFGSNFPLCTELNASQMPGDCPGGGGMGGFGIDWYIKSKFCCWTLLFSNEMSAKNIKFLS